MAGLIAQIHREPSGTRSRAFLALQDDGELSLTELGASPSRVSAIVGAPPREGSAWGIFYIMGKATCPGGGGFAYNIAGAWDSKGFHAAGNIVGGSGTGRFKGVQGRVALLGGSATPAVNGTADIAYELVVDTSSRP